MGVVYVQKVQIMFRIRSPVQFRLGQSGFVAIASVTLAFTLIHDER